MIKKLLVLNGTEGHKFEVGKLYAGSDEIQTVKEILPSSYGYIVNFENDDYVTIETNNVMVFHSK